MSQTTKSVVTRQALGRPLTFAELDANFLYLEQGLWGLGELEATGVDCLLFHNASTDSLDWLAVGDGLALSGIKLNAALATTEPGPVSSANSGAVGTANEMARSDHSHDLGEHGHTGAADGGDLSGGYASLAGAAFTGGVSVAGQIDADENITIEGQTYSFLTQRLGGINKFQVYTNGTSDNVHFRTMNSIDKGFVFQAYDGVGYKALLQLSGYSGAVFSVAGQEAARFTEYGLRMADEMDLYPTTHRGCDVGLGSSLSFEDAFVYQGVTTGSDERAKRDIRTKPLGLDFIRRLRPVSWVWKNHVVPEAIEWFDRDGAPVEFPSFLDPTGPPRLAHRPGRTITHKRPHHGFIAQEVEAAAREAGAEDFAGVVRDKEGGYGLRYHELLGPLTAAVQELARRVEILEGALKN